MMMTRGVGTASLKAALDTFTLWKSVTPTTPSVACQLPIELLQAIFLLLAELYASDRTDDRSTRQSRPDWVTVTHVCRQWRLAALGLHQLWTSITPGLSILWAQAMIERSAPLPVRVDIRVSTSSTDGLHPLAASELLFAASRIRTLRLVGLRADVLRVLDRLRSPSPLEALTLSVYDSGPPVDLSESLFGSRAPHLRRLTFPADTCIRAPLWLLSGVTEFTTGSDIALSELLEALRAMPQLEVLRVQHCRAVWDEDDAAGGGAAGGASGAVALPHLQLVSFRDTTPRRFVLLSRRIDARPTVRRHLFWRSWAVPSWERWSSLLHAMRALVPRDSVPGADDGGLRAARVEGGPARGSFSAWTRSASAHASPTGREDALFLFHIDWRGSPVDQHQRDETLLEHSSPFFHLAGLCGQLGMTHVQDLSVEPDDVEQREPDGAGVRLTVHWEPLFRALGSVQSLRLHRGTPSVLHAVSANKTNTLLPNLQKLYVVRCDVRCNAELQDGVGLWNLKRLARGSSDVASFGNELVAVVRGRYGLEVILIGCSVDGGALDELRREHAQVDVGDEWVYI
ncbi:hypothetical protein BC827DRAFT_1377010 [Russula dissimulans]|nr:hypothetical protein BC827DRAFT_1377010 [Russula dissimulans]